MSGIKYKLAVLNKNEHVKVVSPELCHYKSGKGVWAVEGCRGNRRTMPCDNRLYSQCIYRKGGRRVIGLIKSLHIVTIYML